MASSPDPSQALLPLLSIVAEPPPNTSGPLPNTFVDSVYERIQKSKGNIPDNRLARAWSVAKLHKTITTFAEQQRGAKFDMQIAGHGMAGFLGLGETWDGRYFDGANFLALDGNPGLLANLADLRGMFRKVTLAGCSVGNEFSSTRAIGGTALLFSLKELWGCDVFGALGLIDFSNFDERTGEYNGPMRQWDERGRVFEAGQLSVDVRGSGPAVTFEGLTAFHALNPAYLDSGLTIAPELSAQLVATYSRQRNDGSGAGLASPEFTFKVTTTNLQPNLEGQAWISLDGQCLTIRLGDALPPNARDGFHRDGNYYYRNYFADAEQLNALLRELMGLPARRVEVAKV
jgi:hypothetical protein